MENNTVRIQFQLPPEKFQGKTLNPLVRLEPPRIWNRESRRAGESINWRISMRILHWFIKDTLAMAYAMQSQKAIAFLPHIATGKDNTVKDVIIPRLSNLKALPGAERPDNVIEAEAEEIHE